MKKYIEFSFIRNELYEEVYNEELQQYIIQINSKLMKKNNLEIFIGHMIEIAQKEIDIGNYKVASYLYGLIHNLPQEAQEFNETNFFSYDFLSFYENILDYKRMDILKKVLQYISLLIKL